MNHALLTNIHTYLMANARPIDLARYNFHFHNGSTQEVGDKLQKYQNPDGGFGNALEPDCRLSQSTALATWRALQVINEVNTPGDNEMLQDSLSYLINSYDKSRCGWAIVRPEVDDYPHAPWWEYKAAMAGFGWGNPSAELLGFLIKYGDSKAADIVKTLKEKALIRIQEVEPSEFHEVFNFKALYELADEELRVQLKSPLEGLIRNAVNTNPNEWKGYTATPLRFITASLDPFAHLFTQEIISKNLEFLISSVVDDNHWEPNWDWARAYPKDWEIAKREWSGELTVKNALALESFGQQDYQRPVLAA